MINIKLIREEFYRMEAFVSAETNPLNSEPLRNKNLDINIGDVSPQITDMTRHNTISDTLTPAVHNVPNEYE